MDYYGFTCSNLFSQHRFYGMTRCYDAYIRSYHYIISNFESPMVIKGTVLINENITSHRCFGATGRIKWRYQQKTIVHFLAGQFTEQCRTSSASLYVNVFSLAVIAIAFLMSATIFADSGVQLLIIFI